MFDGAKGEPYVETDPTNPACVYGLTKRDGENAVLATDCKAVILRTSWIYAPYGKNFVRTMLNAAQKMPVLRVVADQRGTPTAALDLAVVILGIVAKIQSDGWKSAFRGIFHATGSGETTWHGFASVIFDEAGPLGHPVPQLIAITTSDWPTAAQRPADLRLNCEKLQRVFMLEMPSWRTRLPELLGLIV